MLALSAAPSTRLPTVALARSSRSKPVRVANVSVRASNSSEVDDVTKAVAMMSLASPLLFTESASAATEMMSVAGGDGRAGLLAFPLLAALGWVGFNIAGPALNQINTMGEKKKAFVAGGMGLATLLAAQNADAATEMMSVAGGDGRAGLLAFPLLAALGWVGFNIAGPALNQINTMGEKKKAFVAGGMGLATLLAAQNADAATEMMSVAGGDGRGGLLAFPLLAALGWVGFNIAGPALNQINTMSEKK